ARKVNLSNRILVFFVSMGERPRQPSRTDLGDSPYVALSGFAPENINAQMHPSLSRAHQLFRLLFQLCGPLPLPHQRFQSAVLWFPLAWAALLAIRRCDSRLLPLQPK